MAKKRLSMSVNERQYPAYSEARDFDVATAGVMLPMGYLSRKTELPGKTCPFGQLLVVRNGF